MTQQEFEDLLDSICLQLTSEAQEEGFNTAFQFENRVREVLRDQLKDNPANDPPVEIDFNSKAQAFPDIAVGDMGVEVKFTLSDTWRSVANSVLETNRVESVKHVYVVFCKMGGTPDVKWGDYERCVMHVRTSHVPRFEVDISTDQSLFSLMGISYDDFRILPMEEKMKYIRAYARSRLREGERLWWIEDSEDDEHSLPIQARLYTSLSMDEKTTMRAEAALLCPAIVKTGRSRHKYDDAVLFLLTYHGVLCHQARDLFSAGSVANPNNDDNGGIYIERALLLLQDKMREAALRMEDELFVEYWGESVPPEERIKRWLEKADALASDWVPSRSMFLE